MERCSMNEIANLQDKIVNVTMRGLAGKKETFTGKVVDYAGKTIWVEVKDGDWISVNLANPHINTVEEIVENVVDIENQEDLKEIRKELEKSIKWIDEDIEIAVKIYDCMENDEQTYDVEILLYVGDEYSEGWINQTFYGEIDNDDLNDKALKYANKRAKSVLKTVKGWFNNNECVTVLNNIEVYHV